MTLIIGGAASGKRAYAKSLGYNDDDISDGEITAQPVVANLQDLVFRDPDAELFDELVTREVVICNEVGCGVVPMERGERHAREACGRLCVRLAEAAESVIRIVCGVPTVLK